MKVYILSEERASSQRGGGGGDKMSQIIIIDSAEALAEQIEQTYLHHGSMKIKQAILACLHPIEVPNDAQELVDKVREGAVQGHGLSKCYWNITDAEAAALIEGLQRRVPRKMLDELWDCSYGSGGRGMVEGGKDAAIDAIAAKYGYRAE